MKEPPRPLQHRGHLEHEPAVIEDAATTRQIHRLSLPSLEAVEKQIAAEQWEGSAGQGEMAGVPVPLVDPLKEPLEQLYSTFDYRRRTRIDPVSLVFAVDSQADREIVALFSSALAYGRVESFMARLHDLMALMKTAGGPRLFVERLEAKELREKLNLFRHRVTPGSDLVLLTLALRKLLAKHGSLEAAFAEHVEAGQPHVGPALEAFVEALHREAGATHRSFLHLIPTPRRGSACKRLNLFLRWMVRVQEGVDPGGWSCVPPSHLLLPLDTHTLRMAQRLGLTRRKDASWRTVLDVTARLRRLDPEDPVKYDFALCHLGMSGDCPQEPSKIQCERCLMRPACQRGGLEEGQSKASDGGRCH